MACLIPTSKNSHSEYLKYIPFPLQQWLHECAWMLNCSILSALFWVKYILLIICQFFMFIYVNLEIYVLLEIFVQISFPITSLTPYTDFTIMKTMFNRPMCIFLIPIHAVLVFFLSPQTWPCFPSELSLPRQH